jgi:hypothetical protein
MNELDGHVSNVFPILLPLASHEKLHLLVHLNLHVPESLMFFSPWKVLGAVTIQ